MLQVLSLKKLQKKEKSLSEPLNISQLSLPCRATFLSLVLLNPQPPAAFCLVTLAHPRRGTPIASCLELKIKSNFELTCQLHHTLLMEAMSIAWKKPSKPSRWTEVARPARFKSFSFHTESLAPILSSSCLCPALFLPVPPSIIENTQRLLKV